MDTSAFFDTATPYSHEEWLYNGWTRDDLRDPPRPDPPWLLRLELEREQMEAEDEYSRLLMAQSAAMLQLMLGRKREIVQLCHGTVAEVLERLWVVLDERSRETAERNRMRAADVASRRIELVLRRDELARAMRELKARLEAEYDRHWHRVNHGMPTGLVEVVEPRDQWFCVACGLRQHGRLEVSCSACGAARPQIGREQARQLEERLADVNQLYEHGALAPTTFALEADRTLSHDELTLALPAGEDKKSTTGVADDDGAPPELLGLGTTIENERVFAPRRQGGGGGGARRARGARELARDHIRARSRAAPPRQSRSCSRRRACSIAAVGPPAAAAAARPRTRSRMTSRSRRSARSRRSTRSRRATPCSRRRTRSR